MEKPVSYSELIQQNIKMFRKQAGLTQTELSKKCGVSASTIAHAESSGTGLTLQLLEKISFFLDKPIYLFFMDESMQKFAVEAEQQQKQIKNMLLNIIDFLN